MTVVPSSHVEDGHKLEADGKVELFQIWLRSGAKLYLKANNEVSWQGHAYESIGIKMTGVGNYADDKVARPSLQIVNPKGIFSRPVMDGDVNRATVHRYRVLLEHVEGNVNIFQRQSWTIMRVATLIKDKAIIFEMRDQMDGHNFITPARMYIPPEFPLVSLS